MRHLLSILAGLIIAPATWLLVGFGQAKFVKITNDTEGFTLSDATVPLALLAAAGLVYGLIAVTRISPLGPLIAALFFAGGQLAYAWRPMKFGDLLSGGKVFGETGVLTLPASTGVAAIMGGALLLTLFSIGRWRRWPKPEEPEDLFDRDTQVGSPTPPGARQSFGDAPLGPPLSPVGAPEEATRAFAGAPPPAEPPRYEPFGYVSDEPARTGPSWADEPEPAWRTAGDMAPPPDPERTGRLRGGADVMGPPDVSTPWTEPPRHR